MADSQILEIKASTVFKVLTIALSFVLLYLLRDVIVILFCAIIIASAVGPFANWLESKKIPRLFGVLGLYLSVFILLILLMSMVIPFMSYEVGQLTQSLPKFITSLSGALEKAQQSNVTRYFDFLSEIQNFLDSFSQFLQVSAQSALSVIINIFGGIVSFLAIIVISFYLSVMRQGVVGFVKSVLPEKYEDYVLNLWHRSEKKVGRWLQGQVLLALSVGLVVFIGLSIMGFKYALLLGVLAMALEIVPIVGPVISAIPAVMLGFMQSPTTGLWILVFYVAVQQVEGHIFAPLIIGKTVGLNPVTVIIALLIGGKVAGILGILLSIPVAVIIVEVLDDIARQKENRKTVTVS